MPNAVGGSSSHPAYDPLTKIKDYEVLEGNNLYTINLKRGVVIVEPVDGRGYEETIETVLHWQQSGPVRAKIIEMQTAEIEKKKKRKKK